MTIRERVRYWLGIEDLIDQVNELRDDVIIYQDRVSRLRDEVVVSNLALGRIVAKLDPIFAIPEDDPKRRAESDALGEAVIRKLRGEYLASKQHG